MIETLLCREMKWSHDTYEGQPSWLIDSLLAMLNAEAEAIRKQNQKTK